MEGNNNQQSIIQNFSWNEILPFQDDPFLFSNYPLPPIHDLSSGYSGSSSWVSGFDEFPSQENVLDTIPLMASFPTDPLYSSLDILPTQNVLQEDFCSNVYGNYEFGVVPMQNEEMGNGFEGENKQIVLYEKDLEQRSSNSSNGGMRMKKEKKMKRSSRDNNNSIVISSDLSRETISQYFYMPITQAARELNVGLTLLKKRCRELGIPRWPHRKLMSLEALIKNVQEMGKNEEGEMSNLKVIEALELLENQKKQMEEKPGIQLEEKTKKLRQACFKANYKKRRLMGTMDFQHQYQTPSSSSASFSNGNYF